MSRSAQSVNTVVRGMFTVYDAGNAPVTGLTQADFTRLVAFAGVDSANLPAISEVGSGRYTYTITPNVVGYWHVLIRQATHNPRGYVEEFDVS